MPDFTIRGNPGAIRSRAATTTQKGQAFADVGNALAKITTDGWTGRAADHFRSAFEPEPTRWTESGNGFIRAGNALTAFADAVESAQSVAAWAEKEYARGDDVTAHAKAAYDADVAQGKEQQANYLAQGIPFDLTIVPFDDPGEEIRQNALSQFASAKADLDAAAQGCAGEVKAGCAAAPEKPNWFESGLRFVAGVWEGAGEAIWDLLTISPFGLVNTIQDTWKLANGDLTTEELMAKYQLSAETAAGLFNALQNDPVEFGKQLGKGLLDWDTWADDPARAWGHLVPDIVITAATLGAGGAAAGGARGAEGLADGAEALNAMNRAEDVVGLGSKLDDLGGLNHLDDLGDVRHVDLDALPDWTRGTDIDPAAPGSQYYPDDYQRYGDLGEQRFFDRYWDEDAGGWDYPTASDGHADGYLRGESAPTTLSPGDVIDRYSNFDGSYASPEGTPFEHRALPPSSVGTDYTRYEVLKPLPESVTEGKIAPWFEQPGGGIQYKFDQPMSWYVRNGYLGEIP